MTTVDINTPLTRRSTRRFIRFNRDIQPGLWLAWLIVILVASWALFPSLFTGYNPIEGVPGAQRLAPQAGHWLGTDQLGRDLYARIVWGTSHSLSGALVAVTHNWRIGCWMKRAGKKAVMAFVKKTENRWH